MSLQLIEVGKRHLECPLYHSGAAGIDITIEETGFFPISTLVTKYPRKNPVSGLHNQIKKSGDGSAVSLQLIERLLHLSGRDRDYFWVGKRHCRLLLGLRTL